MKLTKNEMVDMVYTLGESDKNVLLASRIYAQRYPDRRHPRSKDFRKLQLRFEETGDVKFAKPRRRKHVTEGENENIVLQSIIENPQTSTRAIMQENQISQQSVVRIIKKNHFHPYHVQFVQSLNETDHASRLHFCLWARNMEHLHHNFFNHVLFTDEATFHKNGKVNIRNHHYYDNRNPHLIRPLDHQHRWSINVWSGIVGGRILGPFFFDGPVTGNTYLHFLQNNFQQYLEDVPLNLIQRMWFQHDGAPPHYSRIVREYLDAEFGNRWIGRGGPIPWPARSPDLTKPDFFLWGFVHDRVYQTEVTTKENMQQRIIDALRSIDEATLEAVNESFLRRIDVCIDQEGRHFEQLL